ncbi:MULTISPECIES: DUF493 domain-containing protein [Reichenbachiella]|uniref:DUF493 domain-containing protein n=1 Tax=Reichenbachiella agariperforans TaxID=156994 RepID=A0A1M6TN86_REIAG|nr:MULTISPECIES: DUF493 domain-containing protein [Reichenbachiella]MBU2915506.1 DUF493 domain-containing protein [Reichenbachiella agariperforans]RJE71429.1 hypothetical protein BGP76_04840 [Reichenbachiella sp. MSK19-1]SHK58404.1 hypothetical protein SAMN04488028_106112 [Reichenbachiella agariperforans]
MDYSSQSFKDKLESVHSFPTLYMFKFIVPEAQVGAVNALFPKHDVKLKPSKNGKYVSATIQVMAGSSDQVIEVYESAKNIEGIISL